MNAFLIEFVLCCRQRKIISCLRCSFEKNYIDQGLVNHFKDFPNANIWRDHSPSKNVKNTEISIFYIIKEKKEKSWTMIEKNVEQEIHFFWGEKRKYNYSKIKCLLKFEPCEYLAFYSLK